MNHKTTIFAAAGTLILALAAGPVASADDPGADESTGQYTIKALSGACDIGETPTVALTLQVCVQVTGISLGGWAVEWIFVQCTGTNCEPKSGNWCELALIELSHIMCGDTVDETRLFSACVTLWDGNGLPRAADCV